MSRPLLFLCILCASAVSSSADPLSRIAFGSCHKLDRPFDVWDIMLAQKPHLFVFMGDTIYKDTVVMDEKRRMYDQLAAVPQLDRFRKAVPIAATWDDHDYGENDGGADYPMKDQAKTIFLDFFQEPKDSPRRKRAGIYHAHTYGDEPHRVQVILLDTRTFRGKLKKDEQRGGYAREDDPSVTMLGEEQWKWLEAQLSTPAELRLIVSSIQVFNEEQPNEKWSNLPREKEKLFKTIKDTNAAGVIFLSGDRHHGATFASDIGCGYTVYEITSSGMNCPYTGWDEPCKQRIGGLHWTDNFGMLTIDWSNADPPISMEIHGLKGALEKKEIRLSELRAK